MDPKEALSISIDYEHKVRDHYTKGATLIQDPKGKKVFEILAREEQGHVDYLESRLKDWTMTGKIEPGELASALPGIEWIQEAQKRFSGNPIQKDTSQEELDLLKVALDLERQTSSFYRELVSKLESRYRPLFERFLEIEEGHLAIVQAEIDAISQHGHWFDFREFSLESG